MVWDDFCVFRRVSFQPQRTESDETCLNSFFHRCITALAQSSSSFVLAGRQGRCRSCWGFLCRHDCIIGGTIRVDEMPARAGDRRRKTLLGWIERGCARGVHSLSRRLNEMLSNVVFVDNTVVESHPLHDRRREHAREAC